MKEVYITHGKRTAVGSFLGSLSEMAAPLIGAEVIKAILAESRLDPKLFDEVILGQVITGGSVQNPARQTARPRIPKHPELHQHGLFPLRKTGFLVLSQVARMIGATHSISPRAICSEFLLPRQKIKHKPAGCWSPTSATSCTCWPLA